MPLEVLDQFHVFIAPDLPLEPFTIPVPRGTRHDAWPSRPGVVRLLLANQGVVRLEVVTSAGVSSKRRGLRRVAKLVRGPAVAADAGYRKADEVLVAPREPDMQVNAIDNAEELPASLAPPLELHRSCAPVPCPQMENPGRQGPVGVPWRSGFRFVRLIESAPPAPAHAFT